MLFLEFSSENLIHSTNTFSEASTIGLSSLPQIASNDQLFTNEPFTDNKLLDVNILQNKNEQSLSYSRHNISQNGFVKTLDFGQKPRKEILPVKDTKSSLQRKKTSRIKCLEE